MEAEKLVIKQGTITPELSGIALSDDGESFLFTELICPDRQCDGLTKFVAEEAKDVTKVDFSKNGIPDPTILGQLNNLIHIDLNNNKVKTVAIFTQDEVLLNLKYLDLANNKFTEFPAFKCPKLEYLDVSQNKLEKINEGWAGHPSIKVLKGIDCKFKTMAPFKAMPKLAELYLSNNNIQTLNGYEGLPALKKLHMRHNKIENIDEELPPMESLVYMNLRTNKLSKDEDIPRLFTAFPTLVDLNVINCPIELNASSMDLMIGKMLVKNHNLKRFCKVEITDELRLKSVYLSNYAHNEQKKKEAEEAAAAAAAAAKEAEENG